MSVIDYVKEAANLAKEHGRMDLYGKLLDYRVEMAELREENLALRNDVSELKKQKDIEGKIVFHDGVHWITEDSITQKNEPTPICPRCWDVDKVVVRQKLRKFYKSGLGFTCQNCGKHFAEIESAP